MDVVHPFLDPWALLSYVSYVKDAMAYCQKHGSQKHLGQHGYRSMIVGLNWLTVRCFHALQKTHNRRGEMNFQRGNLWILKTAAVCIFRFGCFYLTLWSHKFTPTISGVGLEQTWVFSVDFWISYCDMLLIFNTQIYNWNRVMNWGPSPPSSWSIRRSIQVQFAQISPVRRSVISN